MKVFFSIIIIVLHLVGFSQQDVNYQHKKLSKFIKKTYNIDEFSLKEIQNDNQLNGKLFVIKTATDSSSIVYIGRVNSCRADGCSIDNNSTNGSFEYFDYIIAFNKCKQIINIKVYNYQATHGQEITAKSWLKQFNYNENKDTFVVNKNIDAISGATISVYAITNDINKVEEVLREYLSIF